MAHQNNVAWGHRRYLCDSTDLGLPSSQAAQHFCAYELIRCHGVSTHWSAQPTTGPHSTSVQGLLKLSYKEELSPTVSGCVSTNRLLPTDWTLGHSNGTDCNHGGLHQFSGEVDLHAYSLCAI